MLRNLVERFVGVGDLDDPLTRERHGGFEMVQAKRFVSRLPLYRLQKQANEVRPCGRQNKPLQRFRAACAAAVRRGRRTLQAARR